LTESAKLLKLPGAGAQFLELQVERHIRANARQLFAQQRFGAKIPQRVAIARLLDPLFVLPAIERFLDRTDLTENFRRALGADVAALFLACGGLRLLPWQGTRAGNVVARVAGERQP